MFGGRLGYCLDPAYATGAWQPYELMSDRVVPGYVSSSGRNDYDECMALPKYNLTRFDSLGERLTDKEDWAETYRLFTEFPQWTNPSFGNFDNLGTAMLLLFEVAALEGWPDVMFAVMGADAAQKYVSPYWLTTKQADGKLLTPNGEEEHDTLPWLTAFLFVLWIVLGCFVLLNMVIGVVLDSFNRMQQENEGLAMMTDAQSDWVKAQKEIIAKRPLKKPSPPRQAWRLPYFRLVSSDAFDLVVMAVIVVNTILMMVDIYEPNSPSTLQSLWRLGFISNCVFFGLYALEMLLKWMGLGLRQYFKDAWNVFDFSLVIITAVDIAFASMQTELPIPGGVLRVVRLLRVVRVLRLLKRAKQLQTIIATVRVSMPGLRNIGLLMCLLMYIFAIFFTQLYWATNYTPGNFGQTTCTAPNASAAAAEPCDTSFDNKASGLALSPALALSPGPAQQAHRLTPSAFPSQARPLPSTPTSGRRCHRICRAPTSGKSTARCAPQTRRPTISAPPTRTGASRSTGTQTSRACPSPSSPSSVAPRASPLAGGGATCEERHFTAPRRRQASRST